MKFLKARTAFSAFLAFCRCEPVSPAEECFPPLPRHVFQAARSNRHPANLARVGDGLKLYAPGLCLCAPEPAVPPSEFCTSSVSWVPGATLQARLSELCDRLSVRDPYCHVPAGDEVPLTTGDPDLDPGCIAFEDCRERPMGSFGLPPGLPLPSF